MTERLFGTDGVRGIANSELTPELALRLGRAGAAELALVAGARPLVVVGRDPRRSGDLLESALVAGLLSAGADVLRVGVVTTPAVAHLVRTRGCSAGAMVSASHNPAEYNGIKFFSADGHKLPDAVEDRIAERLGREDCGAPRPSGAGVGRCADEPGLVEGYIEHIAATGRSLAGLRVVVDCANGAAFRIGPAVLARLGATIIPVSDRPDGLNINDGCGSTHPAALVAAVREHGAHAGVAFDGDADRAIFVDETGGVVDGDQVLAMCGLARLREGRLPGGTVVGTVLSNGGLEAALRQAGGRLVRTAVGDRYVMEAIQRGGYALGGEQSGHIVFADLSTTGDGVLTACQVLGLVAQSGSPLSELAAVMRRFPQVQKNVRVADRSAVAGNAAIAAALREAEAELGPGGRVVVRPSGTEPVVRVMVEGPERERVERVARRLADLIAAELGLPNGSSN